jgi:hypothetical protein
LILLGRITDSFNRRPKASWYLETADVMPSTSPARSSSSLPQDAPFSNLQQALTEFHFRLPPSLLFNVDNFQLYARHKQSQAFLLLHLWVCFGPILSIGKKKNVQLKSVLVFTQFHALVLATHHPTLVKPDLLYAADLADIQSRQSTESIELCRSSARSISDMIAFAGSCVVVVDIAKPQKLTIWVQT